MKFIPSHRKSAKQQYTEKHPVKNFIGANLTTAQRVIADKITLSDCRYFTWLSGRQTGKSFTCIQLLLWFALNKRDSVSIYISKTYAQTLKLFGELYRAIKKADIISDYSKSNFEIEFKNGSRILFRSYQNPDNMRGYSIKNGGCCIVDEAAFADDSFIPQIVLALLQNDKSAKLILVSTPNGCNFFYDFYKKGERSSRYLNKAYLSFKTTYKDNPFCSLEEIENYRQTMPDAIFRQEVLAEFVSSANSAFGDRYKKCISQTLHTTPQPHEKYYFGIDVGRADDYTVCTCISAISGEVGEILRIRHKSFNEIAREIVKMAQKWKPIAIMQEINGLGDPFAEILQAELMKVNISCWQPFTTTNSSKNNIIEALNIAFEEKSIQIPDDVDLTDEIDTFEVSYSPKSHSVTYAARNGCHDDMVMSLAISNWCRRSYGASGQYAIV